MADASYNPKVYRKQGGDELVIASGGTLTLEAGCTLSSTGSILSTGMVLGSTGVITNGGTMTNTAAGKILETVTAHVSAGAINRYGISSIGSATAGARAYTLVPPAAAFKGMRKIVNCVGSTGACTLATTGTFNGTKKKITFGANADGVAIELVATSSANWAIVGYSTAWTTTVKAT